MYVYAHHYSYIYYFLLIVNNRQHWQQIVFGLVYICASRVADFVALRVAVADYLLNIKIHRCIELYKNYFDFFDIIKIANRQQKSATLIFAIFGHHFGCILESAIIPNKRPLNTIQFPKSHLSYAFRIRVPSFDRL